MDLEIPCPVLIKTEEKPLKVEAIDLDDYISSAETVHKWQVKVRNKIKSLFGDQNEDTLNILMKWYLEVLNEDFFEIDVVESLVKTMDTHIQFFHGYFKELNWTSIDGYLDNMEDILALYLDVECELFVKDSKKYEKRICHKILKILKIYLMYREDRMHHVLLKIKPNLSSDRAKTYLDNLFRVSLSRVPTNTSELAFCRAYILHQRWKKFQNPEMHKGLDEIMYKNYSQTPDAVNTNPILKQILQPQSSSVLDVLTHVMDTDTMLCESYFKYVKSQKIQEDAVALDVTRIELNGRNSPFNTSAENEGTTLAIENEELGSVFDNQTHLNISDCDVIDTLKSEDISDDDCLIVEDGAFNPAESVVVHEILGDEFDIACITYVTPKDTTPSEPRNNLVPTEQTTKEVSFLDSIDISQSDSNKGNTNSDGHAPPVSISPPSVKLQNLHNDSVKSREILSRKFTRKKYDNVIVEEVIEIDDTDDDGCTELDAEPSDWDGTKPNNDTEEPSQRFEGLVTPPTSHDDRHNYERDFHNNDLQEVEEHEAEEQEKETPFDENTTNKEAESSSCHTPHSTISNSSDMCDVPTSLPEIISSGSYASPTSPDISSTCEPNDLPCEEEQETTTDDTIVESTSVPSSQLEGDVQNHEVIRINGNRVEHNNNNNNNNDRAEKRYMPERQLRVSVQRIDVTSKIQEKQTESIFTSKQNLPPIDDEVHLRFKSLKGQHGLVEDYLEGDLERGSCPVNLMVSFDLFDDSEPPKEISTRVESPQHNTTNSNTSPSSIVSPEFDRIDDDFKNYLVNYREERRRIITPISRRPHLSEKAPTTSDTEDLQIRLSSDTNRNSLVCSIERVPEQPAKRKRIAFAEEDIVSVNAHEPIIKHNNRIQGILKKSNLRTSRWRVPRDQMNLLSLSRYSVKPNDPCLQGKPCVVIERLSQSEIKDWEQVSEKTRKNRLQNFKSNKNQLQKNNSLSMTMLRVDYDKTTPHLNKKDTVLYRVPEGMSWRANTQQIVDTPDEGMVDLTPEMYFYVPTVCKNTCCSKLITRFKEQLTLCTDISNLNHFPSIPANPFNPMIGKSKPAAENKDHHASKSFIDLNVVNQIVENFDKCNERLNPFDFINQPSAIPAVEEFQKTLKMEEVIKISTIPSDLHNLNLQKFSPSPIMNCFSPHSPTYNYFSDSSNFNDRNNVMFDNEDISTEEENEDISEEENGGIAEEANEDISEEEQETTFEKKQEAMLEEPASELRICIKNKEETVTDAKNISVMEASTGEGTVQDRRTVSLKTSLNFEEEPEAWLPLKKRKHSVAHENEASPEQAAEEIERLAREMSEDSEDISYPAKPAISIAEIQENLEPKPRTFKTPAQRKEMPSPLILDALPSRIPHSLPSHIADALPEPISDPLPKPIPDPLPKPIPDDHPPRITHAPSKHIPDVHTTNMPDARSARNTDALPNPTSDALPKPIFDAPYKHIANAPASRIPHVHPTPYSDAHRTPIPARSPRIPVANPPLIPDAHLPRIPDVIPPRIPDAFTPRIHHSFPSYISQNLPPHVSHALPQRFPYHLPPHISQFPPPRVPLFLPPHIPDVTPILVPDVNPSIRDDSSLSISDTSRSTIPDNPPLSIPDVPPSPIPGVPPSPIPDVLPSHIADYHPQLRSIVTEQFNTHTYNNPTINYYNNDRRCSHSPLRDLQYILPFVNGTATVNVVNNSQRPIDTHQAPPTRENVNVKTEERNTNRTNP